MTKYLLSVSEVFSMDDPIKQGAFQIARKLYTSDIWLQKPSSWKIIWLYILGNVAHKNEGNFIRGRGFFNFSKDRRQIGVDISEDTIKKCLVYMRGCGMIRTTRSTRGMYVEVLNYNTYQDLDNYTAPPEAREKHERSTPVHKNEKNEKNNTNTATETVADDVEIIPEPSEKKKKKKTEDVMGYPEWLDMDTWALWVKYRAEAKKKLTPQSIKLQLKFLAKDIPHHKAILEQSIQNGWTGLFAYREDKTTGRKQIGNVWKSEDRTQIDNFIRRKQEQK